MTHKQYKKFKRQQGMKKSKEMDKRNKLNDELKGVNILLFNLKHLSKSLGQGKVEPKVEKAEFLTKCCVGFFKKSSNLIAVKKCHIGLLTDVRNMYYIVYNYVQIRKYGEIKNCKGIDATDQMRFAKYEAFGKHKTFMRNAKKEAQTLIDLLIEDLNDLKKEIKYSLYGQNGKKYPLIKKYYRYKYGRLMETHTPAMQHFIMMEIFKEMKKNGRAVINKTYDSSTDRFKTNYAANLLDINKLLKVNPDYVKHLKHSLKHRGNGLN